ncbi:hypothetical protein BASA83_013745 [Batrachochytrium salamandrivorans]|nr:hypothetical protein BASA83_013745 [Batrachochytrium salamandrivorans]
MLLLSALRGRLSGHPVLYRQCPCLQSATAAYSTSACPIVRFKSTVTGVASSTEDQVDQVKHTHTGAAIDDPTEHDQEAASGTLSTSRQPSGPMENPEFHRGTVWRYANKFLLNASWKRLIPDTFPTGAEFQFREAEPNVKEGGLYLKFKYKGGTIDEAIEAIQTHVRSTGVRSIFNFGLINAFEVKGRPWVEDMVFRIPSRRLHVEFHGPDLSVEQLYCEFRNFGRIMDITIQPSSVKDLPRFASIEFVRKRSATSARNCIHGEMIDGTRVHIGYEKLTGRFSFVKYAESAGEMWMGAQSSFYAFFFAKGYSGMSGGSGNDIIKTLTHAFDERESEAKRLELHFKQTPDTLVIINGPKGSGKSDLVRKALEHHK